MDQQIRFREVDGRRVAVATVGEGPARADDGVGARGAGDVEPVLAEHGMRVEGAALRDGRELAVGDDGAGARHPLAHREPSRPRSTCSTWAGLVKASSRT